MVSISEKITEEFLARLKVGSDVRPDQIAKLEELLKQEKMPKADDLAAVFTADSPPAKPADQSEIK